MVKKIIFNIVIAILLIMVGMAIIKANKPGPGVFKATLNNAKESTSNLTPKEAKYYRVIEQ